MASDFRFYSLNSYFFARNYWMSKLKWVGVLKNEKNILYKYFVRNFNL